jgi:hypothetical protein
MASQVSWFFFGPTLPVYLIYGVIATSSPYFGEPLMFFQRRGNLSHPVSLGAADALPAAWQPPYSTGKLRQVQVVTGFKERCYNFNIVFLPYFLVAPCQ